MPDSALRELARIDALGATAVRLTRLPSRPVAARADTLGLRLFVDLPVSYVAAPRLSDALAQVAPTLDRLVTLARKHASITHVGLAHTTNTTVPAACETLGRWTERVHDREPSLRTYYVTPFAAAVDRCADAVDHPLVDVRASTRPVARWEAWRARSAPVGIGAVGTWVRPSAAPGLRVPHSPERQARYLERVLSQVLDSTQSPPPVVFIARWKDRASPVLPSRRYGLHAPDGTPRRAAGVARGLYTGTQRVFAFPAGPRPNTDALGLLVLGWGLVALLGGLYARHLFVRRTVARYFTAPGFYRDALREGHDLPSGTNGALLGAVVGALGLTGVRAARLAAGQPGTGRVLAAVPSGLRTVLAGGIEHPRMTGIIVGGVVLGLLLIWMTALVAVARRWTQFSPAQGLMLLAWPCWPAFVALPVALAAAPDSLLSPSLLALFLLIGGGFTLVYFTARVLFDYWIVTGLPGSVVVLLAVPSPLILGTGPLFVLAWQYGVPLRLLWHLALHA
ncbi:MAG: hypothetical protein ABEL04_02505 [Salinibacter sp.]|uniref:hypothetical protein n=1 Tax=Salinibacter sp. TaxID=2065818 RepID=UPI0035D40C60